MKIHRDFAQYTPEWWEARKGKATASAADRIITAKTAKLSASSDEYIDELLADLHCQTPNFFTDRPRTRDMEHGTDCEPQSRDWLAMDKMLDITEVGGCETDDGRFWCSPDGLVMADQSVVELKCPALKTHMGYLRDPDKLRLQYRPQCHFHLIVTGWPRVLLCSYVVGAPPIVLTVEPDEFTKQLRTALELFWERYTEAKERIGKL